MFSEGLVLPDVTTDVDLNAADAEILAYAVRATEGHAKSWSLTLPNYAGDCINLGACVKLLPGVIRLHCPLVTTVGESAFWGCTTRIAVHMPAVTTIKWFAFQNCKSLTAVHMLAVNIVGYHAFEGCTSLTTVHMPAVKEVEESAFRICTSLTTVRMDAVNEVKESAFEGCTSLKNVIMPVVTAMGDSAFKAVTVMGSAFEGCTAITRVACPPPFLEHFLKSANGPVLVRIPSITVVEGWGAKRASWQEATWFASKADRQLAMHVYLAKNRLQRTNAALPSAGLPNEVTTLILQAAMGVFLYTRLTLTPKFSA